MSRAEIDRILQDAESLRQAGRPDEAIALLRPLAVSHADTPGVLHALGILLAMTKRHGDAAAVLARAAALEPASAEVLNNYGAVLLITGRAPEALPPLRRALELRPDYADARRNLAAAFYRAGDAAATAGKLDEAADALRESMQLRPDRAATVARLASVRRRQHDVDAAVALLERARQIDPSSVENLANLGDALLAAGRADDADEPLRRAIELDPRHAGARVNLGCVRLRQVRVDEAIDCFEQALRLAPDSPRAHMNLGMARLQRGEFARGWPEVEWRFRLPEVLHSRNIYHRLPAWRGEPLGGRTIFVHAEQGFGDALHFVRYVPMIASQRSPGRIVVGCHRSLRRLFARVPGVAQIVELGEALPPAVNVQCPFMSLPLIFQTTLETIPNQVPYLTPPPELVETWKQRLRDDGDPANLKVGVAWSGFPGNPRDRYRSARFADLAPLAGVPHITFYRLQLDGVLDAGGPALIDHTAHLTDWAQTAALMANLDVVVSVDTAVAHLAGALARPTWTLLSAAGEWRWLIDRTDSPWYPTMRLFRQQKLGDWSGVMRAVATELARTRERQAPIGRG
jgi:tetratricopeptide (TPR) repeat protein